MTSLTATTSQPDTFTPVYRLGAWIFGADASAISLEGMMALISAGVGQAIRVLLGSHNARTRCIGLCLHAEIDYSIA